MPSRRNGARTRPTRKFPGHRPTLEKLPTLHGASLVYPDAKSEASPSIPEDVFAAFTAIGVPGPYCQFLYKPPMTKERDAKLRSAIKAAPNVEARERAAQKIDPWFVVDEHALTWQFVIDAESAASVRVGKIDESPRMGTGSGRVEQWFALARMFTSAVRLCQEQNWFTQNNLDYAIGSEAAASMDANICLGVTDGRPILALYRRTGGTRPEVSLAGQAMLVWAVAHERLRRMYADVPLESRFLMRNVAEYLTRRTPVLEWTAADFDLLQSVKTDLVAGAPLWPAKPGEQTPASPQAREALKAMADPYIGEPIDENDASLLLFLARHRGLRRKVADVTPDRGPQDRKSVGRRLRKLADRAVPLVDYPRDVRKGVCILPAGAEALRQAGASTPR